MVTLSGFRWIQKAQTKHRYIEEQNKMPAEFNIQWAFLFDRHPIHNLSIRGEPCHQMF